MERAPSEETKAPETSPEEENTKNLETAGTSTEKSDEQGTSSLNNESYKCWSCNEVVEGTVKTLKSHRCPTKCPMCEHNFMTFTEFYTHCTESHSKKAFKCPKCNRKIAQHTDLQNHWKEKSCDDDQYMTCKTCMILFKKSKDYGQHLTNHLVPKKITKPELKCPDCDETNFASALRLIAHMKKKGHGEYKDFKKEPNKRKMPSRKNKKKGGGSRASKRLKATATKKQKKK